MISVKLFYFFELLVVYFWVYMFNRLPMLKSLDVSFNLIGKIPEEIGSATLLVKYVF